MIIKSKLLKERLKKQEEKDRKEKKEWWDRILPRKGSVLRQLVDTELSGLIK
jgi:hypothetical protein